MPNSVSQQKKHKSLHKSKTRIVFVVSLLIFALTATGFWNAWSRSHQINQEIVSLERELDVTQQKNTELHELITYLNSQAYIEEKARRDLGLKQEGERVVVIPEDQLGQLPASSRTVGDATSPKANPAKWLELFLN